MKRDILTKEDIFTLITSFYSKVRTDEILSAHFSSVDWEHHTPIIVNFWASILLGDQSYVGNPFLKHMSMKLQKRDFARWLHLFITTVDDHFEGQKADEAKQRANSIAEMFQYKMKIDN